MVLYGSETWTLKRDDIKRLEAFEMWVWRRIEKIKWTERMTNMAVLNRIVERRKIIKTIVNRKRNWIGHVLREGGVVRDVLESRGTNGR